MSKYYPPVTLTGNPVNFSAPNGGKLDSVSVQIIPTQDLHGYANPWPGGGGKNKIDKSTGLVYSTRYMVFGVANPSDTIPDGSFVLPAGDYTFSLSGDNSTNAESMSVFGADGTRIKIVYSSKVLKFTNPSSQALKLAMAISSANFQSWDNYDMQMESGSTATAWEPYANICPITGLTGLSVYVGPTQDPDDATVYNVDWTTQAGTVYGGTLDVVTGVMTVTMANIASYNGETITEPWLSSMDAYAAGTTPTIGAQVVYTLATPITYQLTPKQIAALIGQNYIWSSNNQTLNTVLTAPATGFAGWLIKCVTNGTPVEIPLKYMRAETYTVTPDQRMEWSAERDVTGVLHRETVQNLPPKIEFNTPLMTNSDINALNSIIKAAFTSYLQRNITIQFYDPERDQYWEWDCYMPDVKYHIRNADTVNNIINYEELRYAFIGY